MSESSEENEFDRSNSLKSQFEFILDSDGLAEGGPWNQRRRRGRDAGRPRGAGRRRIWPDLAAGGGGGNGGWWRLAEGGEGAGEEAETSARLFCGLALGSTREPVNTQAELGFSARPLNFLFGSACFR
jgi:hypothetical protein